MNAPAETQTRPELRGFLHGLPGVDRVGAEARAAMLASRSIKTTAKQWALDAAISMIDLTTLEGQDTPGKVRALCAKAKRPDPADPTAPMVAAVCVYPDLAHVAAAELRGSGVHRQRRHRVPQRPDQPRRQAGQREVRGRGRRRRGGHGDRPRCLPRRALPAGLRRDRRRPGSLRWGAPQGDPGNRRGGHAGQRAARVVAGHAGGRRLHQDLDRQGHPGRHASGDPGHAGGRARLQRGARAAGRRQAGRGIRTAKDALRYLVLVNETAGDDWLDPRWFRLGASSLLNDLLMQRTKMATGRYSGPDYFTLD